MKKKLCLVAVVFCAATLFGQTAGSFPCIFHNLAQNTYADSQIYVYAIGMANGAWNHLDSLGNPQPFNAADVTAPGHLTKGGRNFPNYAFRITSAKNFRIPPVVGGGRIYMSVGSPMFMTGSSGGVQLPDPNNSGDPNDDVYYDWFEYTYLYNQVQFGGNTTQVDIFGFPFVAKVCQSSTHYNDSCGISGMARDQIIQYFTTHMSAPFQGCIKNCRVVAPRSASQFGTGGAYVDYLKPYIDSMWAL